VAAIGAEPVDPPLALTDEVTLRPAPGHNHGHLAVWIESGGKVAALAGHLFLNVFEVADPTLAQGDVLPDDLVPTRRAILDELAARRGLLLLPLVGGPSGGAGLVQRDDDGSYRLNPRRPTP
jgi:glyoxylase-like metal-dependent hydrolase (beta-lactamase superfamily II)